MKKISLMILTLVLSSLVSASETEGEASHHDWNKVSPQPVADTIQSKAPSPSKILAPNFLEKVKGTEVTLKWEAIEGTEYHLQVAKDPLFKWLLVNSPNITQTEYNLKDLTAGQQYFWRVYTQKPKNWAGSTKGPAVKSTFEVIQ